MLVRLLSLLLLVATGVLGPSAAVAQSTKPNILVIWKAHDTIVTGPG